MKENFQIKGTSKKVIILLGGFNPSDKYSSKWESYPNRGEHKKHWNHHT